eukprot:m.7484 g.7484  ORF g.7484 m.7484 type:complete len:528 (+) comp5256_c0_seq3:403-1986(+)
MSPQPQMIQCYEAIRAALKQRGGESSHEDGQDPSLAPSGDTMGTAPLTQADSQPSPVSPQVSQSPSESRSHSQSDTQSQDPTTPSGTPTFDEASLQSLSAQQLMNELVSPYPSETLAIIAKRLRILLASTQSLEACVQSTIDSGKLPDIVPLLACTDCIELQYEVCWIFTNIASGTSSQTQAVVEAGACPNLVKLLQSPVTKLCEQAAWCLGNISGDGCELRDMLLEFNVLETLLSLIAVGPSMIVANLAWVVSNFYRFVSPTRLPFEKIEMGIDPLCTCLEKFGNNGETAENCLWALCYIAESEESLHDRLLTRCTDYILQHSSVLPAVRMLGFLLSEYPDATQHFADAGALPVVARHLNATKGPTREAAAKSLAGICQHGSDEVITSLMLLEVGSDPVPRFMVSRLGAEGRRLAESYVLKALENLFQKSIEQPIQEIMSMPSLAPQLVRALSSRYSSGDEDVLIPLLNVIDHVLRHSRDQGLDIRIEFMNAGGSGLLEDYSEDPRYSFAHPQISFLLSEYDLVTC